MDIYEDKQESLVLFGVNEPACAEGRQAYHFENGVAELVLQGKAKQVSLLQNIRVDCLIAGKLIP